MQKELMVNSQHSFQKEILMYRSEDIANTGSQLIRRTSCNITLSVNFPTLFRMEKTRQVILMLT